MSLIQPLHVKSSMPGQNSTMDNGMLVHRFPSPAIDHGSIKQLDHGILNFGATSNDFQTLMARLSKLATTARLAASLQT